MPRVRLDKIDPEATKGITEERAQVATRADIERLGVLQERLYAENRRALLVVLQGMDTSGKDGTIKHVFTGINPIGCQVTSFKQPSDEELDHDFLWRIHRAVPRRGNIGIFNRSHYEDVVVVRVHGIITHAECKVRYERINAFERTLTDAGTVLCKFFLHISKGEQKQRLLARLRDPQKNWKYDANDLKERARWDDYQQAYEDAISACSTRHAPFTIVPADKKWYRNWVIARALVKTLERMDPKAPACPIDTSRIRIPD